MTSKTTSQRLIHLALWVGVPYLLGCLLSTFVLPVGTVEVFLSKLFSSGDAALNSQDRNLSQLNGMGSRDDESIPPICRARFNRLVGMTKDTKNAFDGISLMMHRNGQPTPCGEAKSNSGGFMSVLTKEYSSFKNARGIECPATLSKYEVEALLTTTFQKMLSSCPSEEKDAKKRDGFLGFCDMGPSRTPILLDHDELVPVTRPDGKTSLPCHFHTREGLRITKLKQLVELAQLPSTAVSKDDCEIDSNGQHTCALSESTERHIYAVPAGRVFMFAASYIGELFYLPHVEGSEKKAIYLEVISLEPRVFDVFNFFSRVESDDLVQRALAETSESHRIKRSSTGASGYNLNSKRTSESGFDTVGHTAVTVKKRCFKLLGYDQYMESHSDGLQILRYNISKAYNSHLDWIEDKSGELEFDFESGGSGGNRFATILLYMSDMGPEDGGETVFPRGWPANLAPSERMSTSDAIASLRASERGNVLEHDSWEEKLVAQCRTRLSIRPHSSRAVLFYSQYPNGDVDPASLHGACPVLSGQKFAANLWVWNTPRQGYPGAPVNEKFRNQKDEKSSGAPSTGFETIHVQFQNSGDNPGMDNAELYFEDQFWGKMGPKDPPLAVNSYRGHVWNVKVDGNIVKTWSMKEEDGLKQTFTI